MLKGGSINVQHVTVELVYNLQCSVKDSCVKAKAIMWNSTTVT